MIHTPTKSADSFLASVVDINYLLLNNTALHCMELETHRPPGLREGIRSRALRLEALIVAWSCRPLTCTCTGGLGASSSRRKATQSQVGTALHCIRGNKQKNK